MIDSTAAAQAAFYAALNGASAVTALAEVWGDAPPEDTQPPLVIVDEIGIEPIGGKDGGLDRAEVKVVALVRTSRADLSALQSAIRNALEDQTITAAGASLSKPVVVSTDGGMQEDGVTYIGEQKFQTIVQAA